MLAPTRELAIQIQEELRELCAFKEGVRVVCLYGGQPIDKQITQLKKRPQIVVATPGRLMDHMKRRTVRLDKVETVVLDEADRMLDMGFIQDVTHILEQIPHRRNLGLFSATISREVMDISWVYQRDPVEITVRPDPGKPARHQPSTGWRWTWGSKVDTAGRHPGAGAAMSGSSSSATPKTPPTGSPACCRCEGSPPSASTATWARQVREKVLCTRFRAGQLRVLVATDVAARGLDIDDVDAVSSIMTFRTRTSTMSTALGGPAGPSTRARPTTSSPPSPTTSAWTKSSATTSTT